MMNGWDVALLALAGYLAVTSLVRLMITRSDRLIEDLNRQVEIQQQEAKRRARKAEEEQRLRDLIGGGRDAA